MVPTRERRAALFEYKKDQHESNGKRAKRQVAPNDRVQRPAMESGGAVDRRLRAYWMCGSGHGRLTLDWHRRIIAHVKSGRGRLIGLLQIALWIGGGFLPPEHVHWHGGPHGAMLVHRHTFGQTTVQGHGPSIRDADDHTRAFFLDLPSLRTSTVTAPHAVLVAINTVQLSVPIAGAAPKPADDTLIHSPPRPLPSLRAPPA
jgi:hypothetical protein